MTPEERARLSHEFDTRFATTTGYWALDERIAKTRAKKAELLQVLDHPEIPLHNNEAELGARMRVRTCRAIWPASRMPISPAATALQTCCIACCISAALCSASTLIPSRSAGSCGLARRGKVPGLAVAFRKRTLRVV